MDGWERVEEKFWESMNDLQSIKNLNTENDIKTELMARQIALRYIEDLWRELNGEAEKTSMELANEGGQKNEYGDVDSFVERNDST